jgi:hypothetical protein
MTKIQFRSSPRVHGSTPRVLLNLTVEVYFGTPDFEKLKPQPLFFKMFLSKAHDLVTCVSRGSMTTISSRLWTLKISNFKTYLAPLNFIRSPGSSDAWLTTERQLRSFQVFVFQKSQTSTCLAPLDFIRSPGSGDAWLSAVRRSRSFRVFVLRRTQLSTFAFLESAWISAACPPELDD